VGPVPIRDAYVIFQDSELDVPAPGLIANDLHPEGKDFILSNFFAPEHGSLPSIVTNGAFRYVPPEGFVGTDEFRYILRDEDGVFSEPVTVTIEVLPDPNRPPVGAADFYGTMMDTTLDVPAPGLIANDVDPDGDGFILSNFFAPEHGSLPSIVTNGAFRYVPPDGFVGTDEFRYILRDEHGAFSDEVTVTILVMDLDTVPPEIVTNQEPIVLWPPDQRQHDVDVSDLVVAVTDAGDPDLTPGDVVITAVEIDEPETTTPAGGTAGDVTVHPDCGSVALRATREQPGNGRVYTIHLAVVDSSGNVGTATTEVHVPNRPRQTAERDQTVVTVAGPCGDAAG
jgi:hypothetical protein